MFAEKLKNLRTAHKMSQKELAERIGIAKSVISFYESGERFPSYDVLIKISRIFNVTTDFLLDVERGRMIDISGLSDEDAAVVASVIEALKRNSTMKNS